MQTFIAGYCEISLIKSVSERRNYFEPGTDEYYNRKANTSSANTIGNDTGRTGWGMPLEKNDIDFNQFEEVTICSPIWVFSISAR